MKKFLLEFDENTVILSQSENRLAVSVVTDIFGDWNPPIYEAKAELVHFWVADRNERTVGGTREMMKNGVHLSCKELLCCMCSIKDINYRCTLGRAAFYSFEKVWIKSKIPVGIKL